MRYLFLISKLHVIDKATCELINNNNLESQFQIGNPKVIGIEVLVDLVNVKHMPEDIQRDIAWNYATAKAFYLGLSCEDTVHILTSKYISLIQARPKNASRIHKVELKI